MKKDGQGQQTKKKLSRGVFSHLGLFLIGLLVGRNSTGLVAFPQTVAVGNRPATNESLERASQTRNGDTMVMRDTLENALETNQATVGDRTIDDISKVKPVNCSAIQNREPIHVGQMLSSGPPYMVSFSWWDVRIKKARFKRRMPVMANKVVTRVQNLLQGTNGAFVDVGANVGFMTNFAYCLGRPTYSIDPISYDIAKICEALEVNVAKGFATSPDLLHLYHAAAGPTNQDMVNITRPSDRAGYFDQSSLVRAAVSKSDIVTEVIPMITVDSIVPEDLPVALVKIDVQGFEYGVMQGMVSLLNRSKTHPIHILFEEEPVMAIQAGSNPGACSAFLQSFGYNCSATGHDILCSKFR